MNSGRVRSAALFLICGAAAATSGLHAQQASANWLTDGATTSAGPKQIAASARGGLSAGAGVVYVPATDSTLYAFGFPIEK